ncbi:hypothetical protein Fmac_028496 [Flemingia macrophylla]|uniref:Uncharacterized protein n=1 Tax=Flemingia macrophylla TaxID=520843 RepID=A0ABD1L7M9_9FABA
MATNTSTETRKLEGKLDALVNLVTQQAANQKPASISHQTTTAAKTRHLIEKMATNSEQFSVINDAIVITGVHDVATNTSTETRKLEGKLDTLVNLVTQPAANQQFSARNDVIVIRGVYDVATDTSSETRKLEGNLDALVNLVTQLAANQKPASVVRVCDICSSNDHHTSVYPSSQQSGVDEHPEGYVVNTYSRPPGQQRNGT